MKQDIRLYLSGMLVDFKEEPKILFTYKVSDTQNPTAVKNSFSKSISIEGTDENDKIFGAIYDLSRLQTYGTGDYSGTDFNPLKKADFELYIDSELYETGYFKLTEITKTMGNVTYNITLYGGLGEFIYNLSEAPNGEKLEFKDLMLVKDKEDSEPMEDLGLTISKEAVNSAWTYIDSYSSKYSTLNFAPAYNGLPDNFDADKCVINLYGRSSYDINNVTGITSYNYWAKGECSREMTEWETRDLRSYLMRPCLRVAHLLQTIANPLNNGGFEVELDSKFFNADNPYYGSAWITTNLIKDIIGDDDTSDVEEITGATVTYEDMRWYNVITSHDFSAYNNLDMTLRIEMTPNDSDMTANQLYLCTDKKVTGAASLLNDYVKSYYKYYSAVLLQLVAFNEIGEAVAVSNAYQLSTEVPGENVDFTDMMGNIAGVEVPGWTKMWGYFAKSGNTYVWVDSLGNPQEIRFRFPSSTAFSSLKLRVQRPWYRKYRKTGFAGQKKITERYASGNGYLWKTVQETVSGNHTPSWYTSNGAKITTANLEISAFHATSTRYGGFLSGKYISQDKFLTLGITPADFLLSYVKMFGLHIWKDPVEKKIYIADRSVYYDRNNVVDIQELIDRSKVMKITPQVAQTKWYDFNTEQNENEANNQYTDNYGMEFGLQRVNTSYDFDSETKKVYDGKFKGGVQVLEKSGYYYMDYNLWPVHCYNGFTVTTYQKNAQNILEGTDYDVNPLGDYAIYALNDRYDGFDLYDKPQFHTENNESADGNLVMLFYTGMVPCTSTTAGGIWYYLTDDVEEMVSLNDKTPCWIMTDSENEYGGDRIGIRLDYLPKFSRYLTYEENGYITHTWDFGKTLETYVPGTLVTNGCSVYDRCWKDYIADMYSVNSRILSCYCMINGRANPEWLRRFYWFDNSYWRLNTIKEWNPSTYDTTLCEFLKVNDLEAYNLERISKNPVTDFYLTDYLPVSHEGRTRYYTISSTVSAVNVTVEVQDGGVWYYGDGPGSQYRVEYDNGVTYYFDYTGITSTGTDTGHGNRQEVFNIGKNVSAYARTFRFNIVVYGASGDEFYTIYLTQQPEDAGTITATRFGGSGNVPANGGVVLLSVSSNYAWTAELAYDTYTNLDRFYAMSGSTTVQMTVQANNTGTERPCKVTFTDRNGSSYVFEVQQNGQGQISSLDFNADSYTFESATGGTINGSVNCPDADGSWAVTSCPAWISVSPNTGGTGTTNVTITAQANTGGERFGEVVVTAGVERDSINFGQVGASFTGVKITLDKNNFASTGETVGAVVQSSVDWHLEYSGWITPSTLYGTAGTHSITLTITPNTGDYGRVGFIAVQGGSFRDEESVTQDS